MENWDKELLSAAAELEKQKVFINEEREYLEKQKSDLESKRTQTQIYIPKNLKEVLQRKNGINKPL